MHYKMDYMRNMRDLGGYSARDKKITKFGNIFRSDAPIKLSEKDIELIRELGITDVIDFRSETETSAAPNAFLNIDGFMVHRIEFFDPFKDSHLFRDLPIEESYLAIALSEGMNKCMDIILNAKGKVLFHCSAGKDRTGTTAALLEMLAGIDDKDIIADYVLSEVYLKDELDKFAAMGGFPESCIYPRYDNIAKFLELFHSKYPSIRSFFEEKGCDHEKMERLISLLID